MNQLAKLNDSAVSPYKAFADEATSVIRGDLIVFKKGIWYRAKAEISKPSTQRFVVNVDQSVRGWVRWENGRQAEHRLALIVAGPTALPLRNDLGHLDEDKWEKSPSGDPSDPWQFAYYLALRDKRSGDDATFTTSTWGGQRCCRQLYAAFDKGREQNPGLYPIVSLDQEAVSNRQYGRVLEPRLLIVGWGAWDADAPQAETIPPPNGENDYGLDDEIPF